MSVPIKKILTYSLVFLLIVISAVGYLVYDQLNDVDSLKTILIENLEEQTRRNVAIGKAEWGFLGGLNITLDNVSFRNPTAGKPEFTAKKARMVIKLFPLLMEKVEIKKLILDSPLLQVTRSVEGKISLDDLRGVLQGARESETWFGIFHESAVPKVEIINGEIRFLDYYMQESSEPADLRLKNIGLTLGKRLLQVPLTFALKAEIPNTNRDTVLDVSGKLLIHSGALSFSNVTLDGTIKVQDFYLPKFRPYMPEGVALAFGGNTWLSSETGFSINRDGRLNASGKIACLPDEEKKTVAFSDPAKPARATISYKASFDKDSANIEQLDFLAGEFALQGSGNLTRLSTKNAGVSFAIKTTEFMVDKSKRYPPLALFPASLHDLIQKVFKNGALQVNAIKFNGTLDQLKNLSDAKNLNLLDVDLSLNKIDWAFPLPPFQKVNGTLKLQSGEIITDLSKSFYEGVPVAKLTGSIKNLTDRAMLDWVLQSEVDLAQLHKALPKILNDNSFNDLLDHYKGIQGTGAIQIIFKGPMVSVDALAINGNLAMTNATYNQKKMLPLPVTQLKGKITFDHAPIDPKITPAPVLPWRVSFDEFSGNFGKNSFSKLKSDISLLNGKPFLKSSGKLKLRPEEHPVVLTDSFPLEGEFQTYLQQTLFLDGAILADFHSEGNPMTPEISKDWGVLELKDLKLKSIKGFQALSNLSGILIYSEKGIKLKNIRGDYGKSPIKLEAEIDSSANAVWSVRAATNEMYAEDLKDVPFFENLEFVGPAKLEFKLNGTAQQLKFESKLDFSSTSYQYKNLLFKGADIYNKLQLKGRVTGGKAITLEQLVYELKENKITGKGTIKSLDNPVFALSLGAQNFNVGSMGQLINILGPSPKGAVQFDIRGKGNLKQFDAALFDGNAELSNLSFTPENFPKPLNLKGKIIFANSQYNFIDMELASGESNFRMTGDYAAGAQPALNINVTGKTLYLEDFFANNNNEDLATSLRSLVENSNLLSQGISKISINVEKFNYKFWRFKNMAGNLAFKNKILEINRLDAYAMKDKPIQSQGMVSLEDPKAIQFETSIWARNNTAEKLLDLFGPAFGNGLSGKLKTLKVTLKSKGNNWGEIKKSLGGRLIFKIDSGKINTTSLKYGVFNLFGFSEKSGDVPREPGNSVPFERIMGDFSIRDGIAETEKFVYLTADRGTSLVGKFNLNENYMETVVGVAPMPGLDKLLTQIPLVGKILTGGDEKSFIKTYYSVDGKFSDPKITAIPFTSLGKKVIGTLQGILQTPQEIFNLPREEDESK